MRAPRFLLLGLAALTLAGCAGYQLGPVNGMAAGAKSIEIQPFKNQTLEPRLGDAITQSLRERLQTDGTYRLATKADTGDVVVTGSVRTYNRLGLGYLNADIATPENFRLDVVAHITVRDRLSGKTILDKNVK
ncbi:MAG: LPS assembly lipoprotein LptE, partial [Verrucomicrobiota bacterium]